MIGDTAHLYMNGAEPSLAGRFCEVYGNGDRVDWKDHTTPITGLFAVGTDCLGMVQTVYYGGEYLSWAFGSGKIAGESAAMYVAQ